MRNIEVVCKCVILKRLPLNLNITDMTEEGTFSLAKLFWKQNSAGANL